MSLASAALQIIRGGVEAVDVATVQTVTNDTLYMMLMAQWGMIADIDIESESLRKLGGKTRDILGALKCIAQKRTYSGQLHYLPVDASEEEQASVADVPGEKQHQSGMCATKVTEIHVSATVVLVEYMNACTCTCTCEIALCWDELPWQ